MKMIEFKLYGFNWDTDGAQEILKELYDAILRDDHRWHFFWEGSYSLLRFSDNLIADDKGLGKLEFHVAKFLAERNIEYSNMGEWKDNIWVTEKYQPVFELMFHSFSVMAMEMDLADLDYVFDRVVHCFLNMSTSQELWDQMERKHGGWVKLWESFMASEYAAKRALTIGRMA